ncbi:MAG: methylglyoxal synthase [Tidjanibacter sp.]|nr:methylglyoxal synthase [Tidjanibacter sp.]
MNIALVAHDKTKPELLDWVKYNADRLKNHRLICTGTTGRLVRELFDREFPGAKVEVVRFNSGPLGGDQELGAAISHGDIDIVIFFADHLSMQPHDSDIKALSRLAGLYNIPMACNRATADYIISSPLFGSDYRPAKPDFSSYLHRPLP